MFLRTKLGALASIKTGPFGSQLHQEDYVENGTPIVTVEHLGEKRFGSNNLPKVSDSDLERLSNYKLEDGDIVFSRVGSVDRSSFVSKSEAGWLFSGRCLRVRPDKNRVVPQFIYYALNLEESKAFIRAVAVGATMPSINTRIMSEIELQIPPVSVQRDIANVLGALDDKIAANQKSIEAAMGLAFALPGPLLGQEIDLGEVAALITRGVVPRYVDDKGYLVLNQRCIRNGMVDLTQARKTASLPRDTARILRQYDVLVNSTGQGTLGRISPWIRPERSKEKVVIDTHITMVRFDSDKVDPAFAAIILASQEREIADLAEGSTGQTELKRDLLSAFRISLPPIEDQRRTANVIRPLLSLVNSLRDENQAFAKTRDELLPLLMSGKITVRDAEDAAAEVGVEKREEEGNV